MAIDRAAGESQKKPMPVMGGSPNGKSQPYNNVATNLTALTFTDTGLTNGVADYYVVSAVNAP
jgi:hypothetical protein